jgi:hypothetical protein
MHRPLSSLLNLSVSTFAVLFTTVAHLPQSTSESLFIAYSHTDPDQTAITLTAQDVEPIDLLRRVERG